MTHLKILVVATLLIASASTAFAQRVPTAQGTQPTTETYFGSVLEHEPARVTHKLRFD